MLQMPPDLKCPGVCWSGAAAEKPLCGSCLTNAMQPGLVLITLLTWLCQSRCLAGCWHGISTRVPRAQPLAQASATSPGDKHLPPPAIPHHGKAPTRSWPGPCLCHPFWLFPSFPGLQRHSEYLPCSEAQESCPWDCVSH